MAIKTIHFKNLLFILTLACVFLLSKITYAQITPTNEPNTQVTIADNLSFYGLDSLTDLCGGATPLQIEFEMNSIVNFNTVFPINQPEIFIFFNSSDNCQGTLPNPPLHSETAGLTSDIVLNNNFSFPDDVSFSLNQSDILTELDACNGTTPNTIEDTIYLCVAVNHSDNQTIDQNEFHGVVEFSVDTSPPPTAQLDNAGALDGGITLTFSGSSADVNEMTVYYTDDPTADQNDCSLWPNFNQFTQNSLLGSVFVNGLTNGSTYSFCAFFTDSAGNVGAFSNIIQGTPIDECTFDECLDGAFETCSNTHILLWIFPIFLITTYFRQRRLKTLRFTLISLIIFSSFSLFAEDIPEIQKEENPAAEVKPQDSMPEEPIPQFLSDDTVKKENEKLPDPNLIEEPKIYTADDNLIEEINNTENLGQGGFEFSYNKPRNYSFGIQFRPFSPKISQDLATVQTFKSLYRRSYDKAWLPGGPMAKQIHIGKRVYNFEWLHFDAVGMIGFWNPKGNALNCTATPCVPGNTSINFNDINLNLGLKARGHLKPLKIPLEPELSIMLGQHYWRAQTLGTTDVNTSGDKQKGQSSVANIHLGILLDLLYFNRTPSTTVSGTYLTAHYQITQQLSGGKAFDYSDRHLSLGLLFEF